MRQRLDQTRAKVEKLRVDFETGGHQAKTSKQAQTEDSDNKRQETQDDEDLPF